MKKQSLFLIDGSNNVYRSYFAIRGLTNSAGLATNAVYGFITTLKKLLKDHNPDYIAVAFDIGSAKTRHEAYADYNLAYTRFQLGSCDGVLDLLDRSEAIQGQRSEIDSLRRQAEDNC